MYKIISNTPIALSNMSVSISEILEAVNSTNSKFKNIADQTRSMSLDIFKIMDFRNFSGIIGEKFVAELSLINGNLVKNPSIDGYPDLLQNVTSEMKEYLKIYSEQESKISYPFGGIEVKNTFGYKQQGLDLFIGEQRIDYIQSDLQWKAHHQQTNHLLGLYSDYINGYPTIAAVFYSDKLTASDWTAKQNPVADSAMTSFSTITKTGLAKMYEGMLLCINNEQYLRFFGREAQ